MSNLENSLTLVEECPEALDDIFLLRSFLCHMKINNPGFLKNFRQFL